MSRKKIAIILMSTLLAVGIIGGSLAYFTSQDMVSNRFATTGDDENDGSDIKIVECFNEYQASKIEPGSDIKKLVQVQNTDQYNQLIKVRFEVELLDEYGEKVDAIQTYKYEEQNETGAMTKVETQITAEDLKDNLIAHFADGNIINTLPTDSSSKWYNKDSINTLDSEYYYLGFIEPEKYTVKLLESVELNPEAGIEFKGIHFNVNVIADGVQASNNAFSSVFSIDDSNILYSSLEVAQSSNGSVELDEENIQFLE
ncbi:MAG: hypothetical protein E7213_09380 [Clostridium sp.]|nr:hypothetical protein [Clostridium sp.]